MDFYFQLNYNKTVIDRQLYTVLDFLSDMGGVIEIFIIIFSVILAIVNYRYPETFAASRLYKILQHSDHEVVKENSDSNADQSSFFKPVGSNTRQCLNYCLPLRLAAYFKLSRE